MRKHLLVFSYHFPPSNEVGAVRWHRMAELLSGHGWKVTVVAKQSEGDLAHQAATTNEVERVGVIHRQSLLLKVAKQRQVLRAYVGRILAGPAGRAGQSTSNPMRDDGAGMKGPRARADESPSIVQTLLLLAQDLRWAADAVREAEKGREGAVLLSAGPPHTIHWNVSRLARRRRVPHVIDMRDPWSLVERLSPWVDMRMYRAVSRYMESRAVRNAALIVCNTGLAAEAMRKAYPQAASRVVCVMNGADPEDVPEPVEWAGEQFLCVHSGTVYLDRMPVALLKAARKAIDTLGLSPRQFAVAFRGVVEESMKERIMQLVNDLDLAPYIQILPRIDRREAMAWTASAQLAVVLPQDSMMALPSKVFELAQLPSWMLVFAAAGSATAEVLRETSAIVVAPDDSDGAAAALVTAIQAFRDGKRPKPVDCAQTMLRKRQTEVLRAHLDAVAASAAP